MSAQKVQIEDEAVKTSPLTSKNSNEIMGYLTPGAKQIFINWGKHSPKLQSSDILIQNVISGLKLTRLATLLVES